MSKTRTLLLLVAVVACVFSAGCLLALAGGAAAGAGTALYYSGRLEKTVNAPLAKTYQAALAAVKSQELPIEDQQRDSLTGRIMSHYADGKQVWINLKAVSDTATRVQVRVGLVGDQERAMGLMEAIEKGL